MEVTNLEVAGLANIGKLYMREESWKLWDFLNETHSKSIVYGPPGTGKSSLVWAWVCRAAMAKKILWLHFGSTMSTLKKVVLLDNKPASLYPERNVEVILQDLNPSIVVVDGFRQEKPKIAETVQIIDDWFSDSKKIIYVSSQAISIHSGDVDEYKDHIMMSWKIEDYNAACNDEVFFDSIKNNFKIDDKDCAFDIRESFISQKFYYAGSCARWFFGFDFQKLLNHLDKCIMKVSSYDTFYQKDAGYNAPSAVYHLLSIFHGHRVGIVSEYVAVQVFYKVSLKQVQSFLFCDDVKRNPAFEGWVRELEFLVNLRIAATQCLELSVVGEGGDSEEWSVKGYKKDFNPDNIVEIPSEEWLIPIKWNQPGYDFIQFTGEGVLRIVQVTRAIKHSLKLEYVYSLVKNIAELKEVKFLDVVCIVARDKLTDFKPDPTGDYQLTISTDFKTKHDWTKDCIRKLYLKSEQP